MASLLRRSCHLARVSRLGFESPSVCRVQSRLPTYISQPVYGHNRTRRYATVQPEEPEEPKEPKESKTRKRKEPKAKANSGKPVSRENGREAASEQDANSTTQPPGSEEPSKKIDPTLFTAKEDAQQTPSKLTPEEEEALSGLQENLKRGMPGPLAKELDFAFDKIRREGVPEEVREIMEKLKGGAPMDLATAAKLIRLTTQMAREAAEERVSGMRSDKAPRQKAGAHDPGPQSKGDKQRDGDDKPPGTTRIGEIRLDMNTLIAAGFVGYLLYRFFAPGENSREITFQEFKTTFLEKGLVEKIVVLNQRRARVHLHRDAVAAMYPDSPAVQSNFHYYFSIGSVEAFERKLDEVQQTLDIPSTEQIPVAYTDEVKWLSVFLSFAPTLLIFGSIIWLSRRAASGGGGQNGIFGMGRSRAKKFNHETAVKVKFADVAGMDEAKQEIMEFVSFLKEPGIYQKLGAKIPRGAILSGPPGTGKTLLAKATAGESEVPFFSVSGSEFVEMFVGVGASRVRDLFSNARKNTPCIIFIDEIDAIGKSRAKQTFGGGNDEREATLNQILTEMDGFNTSEQVVVLAGTNRPDVLDQALLRPGRFDRHIAIDKPTMDGRKQIFAVHLKKIVTKEDIDNLRGRLAALTPGFSGADIANCVNEAALIGQ